MLGIIIGAIYIFGLVAHLALGAYLGATFDEAALVGLIWPLYLPYGLVKVLAR